MKFIIKLFPEITTKSKSVRLRFIKILANNIRNILKSHRDMLSIVHYWDRIEILIKKEDNLKVISNKLTFIPGIHHILKVENTKFTSLQDIFEKTLTQFERQIVDKTFCVRVKRCGKHEFTSTEVERYVGNGLNQYVKSSRVKLIQPDITINLEIKDKNLFLVKNRYEGIGGFPISTQENVLSLISGGFDSGVSSYMLIRRGCRVHYCLFSFDNTEHIINVYKIAQYLWKCFGSSHRVNFITIDFKPIINEILEKIDNRNIGVIIKRMMIRIASKVAKRYSIQALATGEVLGQVSSQTLTNLHLIDNVSDMLILRPIISYDKEYIINLAHKIGISDFIRNIPEYCGMFSKNPTAKAIKEKIEIEEQNFDFAILDKAINKAINIDIREIFQKTRQQAIETVEIVTNFSINDIVLDIRSANDQNDKPLKISGVKIISLPFYKLSTKFNELDRCKNYLLWCEHGVMSRLQALYLRDQGFANVKVYRPLLK